MAEMILPGTYIEVRDEGLIAAGQITLNNVGIVGTASRGPVNTAVAVSSSGEARDVFGDTDAFDAPEEAGNPLTLVRSIELAYANGAQNVYAVRVAGAGGVKATYTYPDDSATTLTFMALNPGTGYNKAELAVSQGTGANLCNVSFTVGRLVETWRDVPTAVNDFALVINGKSTTYPYSSRASTGGGSGLFSVDASAASGNVKTDSAGATLATAAASGVSGATGANYTTGLEALENANAHIIVTAGQSDSSALISHVEKTSNDTMKRDRIGVIGSSPSNTVASLTAPAQDEGRLVFVGPGLKLVDSASGRMVTLPGTYTAAAVAGRIASLDPHVSPTNKTINANALEVDFNGANLEQLVLNRVLALETRLGSIRIVKGITTSTNTAWAQITTRRIVDYAKVGVRSACDPYIGKLNNDRVRQNMKSTISGFLTDMVNQEMLIAYTLDVSATREQQIRGICQVVMTLQPTFSIDYIRVVMYLQ